MMAITHATIASAGTCLILGTADPVTLLLAVAGSQIPDIDTSTSLIGQVFFPVSSYIEDRFPHRSITHSLLATAVIAAVAMSASYYFLGDMWSWIALPLGHLLSCFSDTFTKQGVQLFYPNPCWAISVSNPHRRIRTGSTAEYWVLAGAIATLVIGISLATNGGITYKVSESLGLKDAAISIYNQNASSHHTWAEIQGVWASDRSNASGKYWIVDMDGSEFIVTDGKSIYKTGKQIVVNKLTVDVGEPSTTEIRTVNFNDENAIAPLKELATAYPNAAIFLNGQIVIDFPEDIKIPIAPNQFPTAQLVGSTLKLENLPLEKAIAQLKGQYAVGTLSAKIVNPKPSFAL
ncbi:MAG: metal-dependent hydrolase [Prochloraceae cyanobacterium]|nr:metal-dependent hydrolase [Prochloraceae cyanobacterium]